MTIELTDAQIESLPAGRELDALVAVEVMGFSYSERTVEVGGFFVEGTILQDWSDPDGDLVAARFNGAISNIQKGGIPFYSTDIAAAWEVVEKLIRNPMSLDYLSNPLGDGGMIWQAGFRLTDSFAWDKSAPLAICRAALKATKHAKR